MVKKSVLFFLSVLFSVLFAEAACAWTYDISLGYGRSKEVDCNYYQQGAMLDAQAFPFAKLDKTLIFGLGLSLADWHAGTNENKRLTTAAASALFRAYFAPPAAHKFRPYLAASFGPAYLSRKKFGEREQGSNFSFQTTMGLGSEVKFGQRELDFSLKLVHYCNGGIFKPNQGINILYVFSIGYLFG
ncbi:MAG: hypothetical protein ACD_21C00199G0002 [uncultured bacterium]|nr:MAG: hypothetical protein ACD_21C00199G0002 [uncultured bacterium]